MSLYLPQSFAEWLPLTVPVVTLLFGLVCLLAPTWWMRLSGLEGAGRGRGEIRSRFAGPFLGTGLAAIALQQPLLFQILGLAWALAASGRVFNLIVVKDRTVINMAAIAIAVLFAIFSARAGFALDLAAPGVPAGAGQWLVLAATLVTAALGIACWVAPARMLAAMNLAASDARPDSVGEPRGELAGFLIAVAGFALMSANPFALLAIAGCWSMTALGRILSMLTDGNAGLRDWGMLALESAVATVFILSVFGVV